MFCVKCGSQLEPNQNFCNKCGSPITLTTEQKEPIYTSNPIKEINKSKKSSGKKNSILYVFGYSFLYILIVAARVGDFFYALGSGFVPFIIMIISTGIPNKILRNFVLILFSIIFLTYAFTMEYWS